MKYSTHSTDTELVQGCRSQNRLAQKYLYQRYFGKMLGICMRYTGGRDEAIEVLNIAFFKVFKSLDTYVPSGKLQHWIAKIVFNSSIDYVRKNTVYRKRMDFNVEQEGSTNSRALENLLAEDLYKIIQKLSSASRAVFCLYVLDGFKHREIAVKLGISEGTSKWHLANARQRLQKMVKKEMLVSS